MISGKRLIKYASFARSAGFRASLQLLGPMLLKKKASSLCLSIPPFVIIEVTKKCNLRCKMCYRVSDDFSLNPQSDSMCFADFKKVADQLKGTRRIWFTGGECLLNQDLFDMIDYASNKLGVYVGLTTNGTLLDREKAERLASSRLSGLNVSIDSAREEVFREIRGTSLKDIVTNMKYLKEIMPRIHLGVNTVVMKDNLPELSDIFELAKDVGADSLVYQLIHQWNENTKQIGVYDPVFLQELQKIIAQKAKRYGINCVVQKTTDWQSFHCYRPFFECFIDAGGHITPCCDAVNTPLTSSLFEADFMSEWNNKNMRRLREQLLRKEYPQFCCCSSVVQAKRNSCKDSVPIHQVYSHITTARNGQKVNNRFQGSDGLRGP